MTTRHLRTSTGARTAVAQVESVWRYPVKSMLGEQLARAEVTAQGARVEHAGGRG